MSSLHFDPSTGTWFRETPRTAEEITAWQLESAWRLAENMAETNPFYAARLSLPASRGASAFRTLPVTSKDDIVADRAAHPPYGLRTVVAPEHVRMVVETSGTSGLGTEVYALDQSDVDAIVRSEAVGFLWAGITAGTRVLLTLPVGMSAAGLWYSAALRFIGANVFSVGPYSSARKAHVLGQFEVEVLIGTPTYVQRLAVVCEDLGFTPAASSVRTIVVAGQPFSHAWAKGIERRWNAALYEQYGCTERAFAWTCPGGVVDETGLRVLHFPPESGYYEVVSRENGEPVAHGEKGELIVTPFGAESSPLLRYATGDQVRWMAPGSCSCRRPLAGVAAGEVERFDDMMKIKGVNVWPVAFDRAVFAVEGVSDYRGAVVTTENGSEQIEIRVEGAGEPQRLTDAIAASIRGATGLTAHVVLEPPGTLAREVPEGFVKVKRMQDRRERRLA
ncbi:MAG TPA: AMP-binding protein [Acidimicrobiia bacterium]|nr:AMP-binding protein [Acidimicrobiia bacterium]